MAGEKSPTHVCAGHRCAAACASWLILVWCEYDVEDITACAVRVYELVNSFDWGVVGSGEMEL